MCQNGTGHRSLTCFLAILCLYAIVIGEKESVYMKNMVFGVLVMSLPVSAIGSGV